MLSLESREWGQFFIEDLCEIYSGVRLIKADMKDGDIPFIGATDSNNGIWLLLARTINLQLRRLASSLRLQAWSKSSSRRMTRVSMAVLLLMIWTGKARANRTISVLTRSHACI